MTSLRVVQLVLCTVAVLALHGCAAPAERGEAAPGTLYVDAQQNRSVHNPFATGGDNGLEVRQWVLSTSLEAVAAALMRYRDGEALDPAMRETFERNGLRLVRVPIEELEPMLAELGIASRSVVTWFGQVSAWRDVLTSPVDETSRALVVSGRVRRFADGNYALMLRSWTLMMEDAPKLQLELIGRHDRPEVGDTVPLLGPRRVAETWLHAVRAELLLDAGYAYVMVFESPSVTWREPGEGETVRVVEGGSNGEAQAAPESSRGPGAGADVGPFHDSGLGSIAPPTLGEVLLGREAGQPRRHLLAFVPRIPERLNAGIETAAAQSPQ